MQQAQYLLFSSVGCHLCEQAYAICLEQIPTDSLRVVDILDDDDKDPEESGSLYSKYGLAIPVLMRSDNKTELYWPFDGLSLQEFLS